MGIKGRDWARFACSPAILYELIGQYLGELE